MSSAAVQEAFEALKAAGLGHIVLYPQDAGYEERVASYWAEGQKMRPHAFVRPATTDEVARVVGVLARTAQGTFALRSGGHTHWAGGSNTTSGLTVDLGALDATAYDAATGLVTIGAGARWGAALDALDAAGVTVCGGRDAGVGVGGFATGGGLSWCTPRAGFSVDNLERVEVVLADGRVVEADAAGPHADLFRALKGGSGNFGIATRFVFRTLPGTAGWGGMRVSPRDAAPQHVDALVQFTTDMPKDTACATALLFAYAPHFGGNVIVHYALNTKGEAKSPIFEKWLSIPAFMDTTKVSTAAEQAVACMQPGGYHVPWMTLTVKNDAATVRHATELHQKYTDDFRARFPAAAAADVFVWLAFQPLPAFYGDFGPARGGNVTGYTEKVREDSQLVLLGILTKGDDAAAREYAEAQSRAWLAELEAWARERGTYVDWLYFNYCHGTQDPLSKIGEENIALIKAAMKKYDPTGFFQSRFTGGFKMSKSSVA